MTVETIQLRVQAPAEAVYRLAAEIELWPAFVRNVRSARVIHRDLDDPRWRQLSISGWRGWLPVGWRSLQHLEPSAGRITLRHLTRLSAGTTAEWTITTTPDGTATDITIVQRPRLHIPLIGSLIAERIIGPLIGRPFAHSILRDIQHVAEGGSLAGRAPRHLPSF
jgi:hypothetical protein